LALFRYLVEVSSNPGDTVLDPCCGSGTTLLAAAELGRDWIGFETSREFVDVAKNRLPTENTILFDAAKQRC
jgi:DNA modification methylase